MPPRLFLVRSLVCPLAAHGHHRHNAHIFKSATFGNQRHFFATKRKEQIGNGNPRQGRLFCSIVGGGDEQGPSLNSGDKPTTESPYPPFCIVNFYHLVDVDDPREVVKEHKEWMAGKQIKGRIYLSSQGINAQYTGPFKEATSYAEWLESQDLFKGLQWRWEPADGHLFPKLRLQFKPNLVQLNGGMSALPVTQEEHRATPLKPDEWKTMLESKECAQGGEPVVLDVRNGYEWDAGHFEGAVRPVEDSFCQTPVGTSNQDIPDPLKNKDKDTPVMMYCTGGIRCDIYSTFLREKGFKNLYSLEGGVHNYFKEEGGELWNGSLFVFDGRMAVSPVEGEQGTALPSAIKCQVCGEQDCELPHINCANIDCNRLFLACQSCKSKLKGCCCEKCIDAPRLLRPYSAGPNSGDNNASNNFGKWGNYASGSRASRMGLKSPEDEKRFLEKKAERNEKRRGKYKAKRDAWKQIKHDRKAMAKTMQKEKEESEDSEGVQSLRDNLSSLSS